MASPRKQAAYITVAEYLAQEETALEKSEYFAGEIFMMAGGTPNHSRIVGNIFAELRFKVRGSICETFNSEQRIMLPSGMYTYPDAMVVCGTIEFDEKDPDAITNPVLLVEVLSPSTGNYDRGAKFEFYREVETFKEYLIIHQDKVHVEHHQKQEDGNWVLVDLHHMEDSLNLISIDTELQVKQLYERVRWDKEPRSLMRKNE